MKILSAHLNLHFFMRFYGRTKSDLLFIISLIVSQKSFLHLLLTLVENVSIEHYLK